MKKRLLSILLMCCMVLTLLPTAAFAEDSTETPPVCSCETTCTADNVNTECPVCGAENAIPQNCGQYIPVEDRTGENGSTEGADDPNGPTELSAADQVQAMINALPSAEAITEENAEEVEAQLEAIDEAKEKLSDEEIDELDMTRYAEAAAALGALVAPMLLANDSPDEQFSLAPGGRYYFDLSGANIPGTANGSLPDSTLHYVPFTYAGTVNAYKLTTEMATTEEHAQKNKYPHSLFVADYAVTNDVSWNALNTADLIFSKNYASGGVDYTLRTPSAGSGCTGLADSQRGVPQSNEWDTMLNKNSGYIQNWNGMYSWGQDVSSGGASYRAVRGYGLARYWDYDYATHSYPYLGFRPVLEVLNSDTLGSGGLKVVTLDLGGGTLGNSSEDIQIIVKTGSEFTAPASDGLTRPDGDAGSFFMWLGSNGKFYAPGDSVPAEVTKLTAQWTAPTYAVTLNTNGGTINSGNVTSYTYGVGATLPTAGDMTYTGHTFVGWYDNENLTGSPIAAIGGTETGNKEYWAKWEINQYTITFDTAGGSVVTPITQNYGTATTAPADPTKTGYTFAGWDRAIPATMPAENLTITAQWTVNQYTIAYDLAGGTAEGNPDTYTIETGAFTLKNPTKSGYTFTGWSGTGLDGENNMTVTIPTGSTGNRTYTAHWRYNGSGHSYSYYTIKATAGAGGSISPSGDVSVREGRDQTFTITPDKGYAVANVKIDGKSIGAVKSYTFENVSRTHTIEVIFMKANGNPQTGVFVDVATGSYYEDAVDCAVLFSLQETN